ncbi:hypothetical protein ACQPWW_13295 [Micromonospora sp. CA-240977]|uniref:hypothetical protein n=1 Tax=Micromonospora sp. CA-240977 TaxID=3239957 RepID=UPI003D89ED66
MTSRERLPGLTTDYGSHAMSLDVLSRPEAKLCLERRLATMRVRAERAAVDEIVDRCGGLALALALVAARVSTHEDVSLARIAADLRHGNGTLDAFTDESMDIDIGSGFEQSRRMLSVGAA